MSHAKGRGAWALVSLAGIALSCLGAILLPFFDILTAIMGALGNLMAAYALPALFVLVRTQRSRIMSAVPASRACAAQGHTLPTCRWANACGLCRGAYSLLAT